MYRFFLCILLTLATAIGLKAQDTITVMQYNLLEYGNYDSGFAGCNETTNNTQDKDECIRTILDYVQPDILTVNEFGATQTILNDFVRHNLNYNGVTSWKTDNILNYAGSNIINHIFYNSDKMELKRRAVIRTSVRDIDAYELYFKTPSLLAHDTIKLVCIVAHLKAGNSNSDENKRKTMVQNAMYFIEENYPNDNVLIMGDFNLYTANEPAYRLLTQTYENSDVLFVDPLSMEGGVGNWHNNRQFAPFHTQATASWIDNPCRSTGGLDDRFDMILMSEEIYMGFNHMKYVNNSYHALGNDGNHFNLSINEGYNAAVPSNVADALFNGSDHLPIVMKMRLLSNFGLDDLTNLPLFEVFPNPVQEALRIERSDDAALASDAEYRITDIMGQTLMMGPMTQTIDVSTLTPGLYFISIGSVTRKFIKQ